MSDPVTVITSTTETISALSLFIDALQNFVPKVVMFCSFAAAFFPPPDPNSKAYPALSILDKIINSIALNFGHVKTRHKDKE